MTKLSDQPTTAHTDAPELCDVTLTKEQLDYLMHLTGLQELREPDDLIGFGVRRALRNRRLHLNGEVSSMSHNDVRLDIVEDTHGVQVSLEPVGMRLLPMNAIQLGQRLSQTGWMLFAGGASK